MNGMEFLELDAERLEQAILTLNRRNRGKYNSMSTTIVLKAARERLKQLREGQDKCHQLMSM
jgi:hypothetical protein